MIFSTPSLAECEKPLNTLTPNLDRKEHMAENSYVCVSMHRVCLLFSRERSSQSIDRKKCAAFNLVEVAKLEPKMKKGGG